MATTLTTHKLELADITGVAYKQDLDGGGDLTPSGAAANPASLPTSPSAPGYWYREDGVNGSPDYHMAASDPATGHLAVMEFTAENLTELRIVTKAKYNSGWLTLWELRSGVWVLLGYMVSNYNAVRCVSVDPLGNNGGASFSWTLPAPLTKWDPNSNTTKLPEPGDNDFLNIEFYISWIGEQNVTRTLRICGLGDELLPPGGSPYYNPVPLFSVDFITGDYPQTDFTPYHEYMIAGGIMEDFGAREKYQFTNDRFSYPDASAGIYAFEQSHTRGIGNRAFSICQEQVNESILSNSKFVSWGGYDINLQHDIRTGEFIRAMNPKDIVASVLGITPSSAGLSGSAYESKGGYHYFVYWDPNGIHPEITYLFRFDSNWVYVDHLELPNASVNDNGVTRYIYWGGIGFSYDRTSLDHMNIWLFRGDGQVRQYSSQYTLLQTRQVAFPSLLFGGAISYTYYVVNGIWIQNSRGEWLKPYGLARRIFVYDSNFNLLRHFGDAGINTIGAMVASHGHSVDSQDRVYNEDQYCIQVWKADGAVAIDQMADATQVSHIVSNEDGTMPHLLFMNGDCAVADFDDNIVMGGTNVGIIFMHRSKEVRQEIFSHGTEYSRATIAQIYGRTGNVPSYFITHRAPWTSRNMIQPECIQRDGNNLYILDGRRLLTVDVTDPTAAVSPVLATSTFTATAGQTEFALPEAYLPHTVQITVNGVPKTLFLNYSQSTKDAHMDPENATSYCGGGIESDYTKNLPLPTKETPFNSNKIIFYTGLLAGDQVVIKYLPQNSQGGRAEINFDRPIDGGGPIGPDRFDSAWRCVGKRFAIGGGYAWVLLPMEESYDYTESPWKIESPQNRKRGVVQKYSLLSGLLEDEWVLTSGGWKDDIKYIEYLGTGFILLHNRLNGNLECYDTSQDFLKVWEVNSDLGPFTRFTHRNPSATSVMLVGENKAVEMSVVDGARINTYTFTGDFTIPHLRGADLDASGNLWVLDWHMMLKFSLDSQAGTMTFLGYVRDSDQSTWRAHHWMDVVIDDSNNYYLARRYPYLGAIGMGLAYEISYIEVFNFPN